MYCNDGLPCKHLELKSQYCTDIQGPPPALPSPLNKEDFVLFLAVHSVLNPQSCPPHHTPGNSCAPLPACPSHALRQNYVLFQHPPQECTCHVDVQTAADCYSAVHLWCTLWTLLVYGRGTIKSIPRGLPFLLHLKASCAVLNATPSFKTPCQWMLCSLQALRRLASVHIYYTVFMK